MRRAALRRVLWGLAVAEALVGGVLLVAPTPRGGALPPSRPELPRATVSLSIDSTAAEEIVLANVFSPTRTPPSARYLPPADVDASSGLPMQTDPPDAMSDVVEPIGGPTLYGTVVDDSSPQGPRALLLLDPATTSPRLYAVGEGDGGYRVISIAPRSVTLRGPAGRVTLRLDSEENHP